MQRCIYREEHIVHRSNSTVTVSQYFTTTLRERFSVLAQSGNLVILTLVCLPARCKKKGVVEEVRGLTHPVKSKLMREHKNREKGKEKGTCHPRFPDSALADPSRHSSCVLLLVLRISFVQKKGFSSLDVQQSLIASAHMQYLEFSSITSSFQCLGQMCPTKAGEKGIERCNTPDHLLTLEHRIASQHGVPNTVVYKYNDPCH